MHAARFFLAAIALAAIVTTATAADNPYIAVTACDPADVNGQPGTRVTFSLHDAGPYVITIFTVAPDVSMPPDTCHAVVTGAPANWRTTVQADGTAYYNTGGPYDLGPGETLGGFTATYGHAPCCVVATFSNGLGIFDSTQLCLQCPQATPARRTTWGSLKVVYR